MTTPDQNSRDPRRDEVIAGEYVLGVLSAEDRRKVEARLRNDRVFAAMVSRWEENLSTINHELETMPPSPRVYSVIEQRIFEPALSSVLAARPACVADAERESVLYGEIDGLEFAHVRDSLCKDRPDLIEIAERLQLWRNGT